MHIRSTHCQRPSCHLYEENFAYLTHADVWPAYSGYGGSYYLDIHKHVDILIQMLGCRDGSKECEGKVEPFDLALDIGANFGHITAKWAVRHFAKDYIMVEANPSLRDRFDSRFGSP